jgi:hypothetical protein
MHGQRNVKLLAYVVMCLPKIIDHVHIQQI